MASSTRSKTIQDYFASLSAPQHARPIMTSLNGDNSWLLSFPRPKPDQIATGRSYYHILFEPWLSGPANLFTSWMIHIRQAEQAAVTDAQSVYSIAREIEEAASPHFFKADDDTAKKDSSSQNHPDIDAIFLGFHGPDHVHEPTLRLFDKHIPVIATPEAADLVRPWDHFTTINLISSLTADAKTWRSPEHRPESFPSWLTCVRLPGHHELNFVSAFVWSHPSSHDDSNGDDNDGTLIHEAILQSPHGTRLDEGPLQAFLDSEPRTEKLALMHGLKESHFAGQMSTFGAEGGLALYRRMGGARYWVKTHHSELLYSGIVLRLLWVNDTPRTLEWALEQEKEKDESGGGDGVKERERPILVDVPNGGAFVLE